MNTFASIHGASPARRGGALILTLIAVVAVTGVAAAAFSLMLARTREVDTVTTTARSMYLAEAGITDALSRIAAAEANPAEEVPTAIGSKDSPSKLSNGSYWAEVTDNLDGTYTVQSTGSTSFSRFSLEGLIGPLGGSIFDHAIFAGNSSGDPGYTMRLSGAGIEADAVDGDIFSGGDIELAADATLTGEAFAKGTITGVLGTEDISRPIPDIGAMNYETNNDFDVAALFASATLESDDAGGEAWQLPESSPAHIFRKNPDDRTDETSGTAKDDYFLEDPYESFSAWTAPNGEDALLISLSGTMGAPGAVSTDKVFFIDGNLWVHNKNTLGLYLENSDPDGFKVTFVVKGNVYFSDDIYLGDPAKDGIAFIAIEDETEPDSGNIYLGDPRYGTVSHLETFLYAENDFYDLNLDEDGSKEVEIIGNMTAGNHVRIERDFVKDDASVAHSQLMVDFDDRISTGSLILPGLPSVSGGVEGFTVLSWRRVGK